MSLGEFVSFDYLAKKTPWSEPVSELTYSRGWVDLVPDPLLYFSRSDGNRTRASGSVAKNSDHLTTEAADYLANLRKCKKKIFLMYGRG
jgi:hypothetical protein